MVVGMLGVGAHDQGTDREREKHGSTEDRLDGQCRDDPKNPWITTRRSLRVHARRISNWLRSSADMRPALNPWILLVSVACVMSSPGAAMAKTERIHGIVLAITPKTGEAIIRHDAFGSMPAMTMPFKVLPPRRTRCTATGQRYSRNGQHVVGSVDAEQHHGADDASRHHRRPLPARHRAAHRRYGPRGGVVRRSNAARRSPSHRCVDRTSSSHSYYTRCQDPRMCPLISAKFNALQHRIGTRKVHLVEVTLDPSYDRPAVLTRYAKAFGADPARWDAGDR